MAARCPAVSFRPNLKKGEIFLCWYETRYPEGTRSRKAHGVDEVQALLLAMQMAHADLLSEREKTDDRCYGSIGEVLDCP